MSISREIVRKAGILPRLRLGIKTGKGVQPTGLHTVKFISDKIVMKPPREEGDEPHYVRYIFEEDGVQKQYDTRLKQKGGQDPSYFVQAMAEIEEGETITLEMKKAGIKNYVEIIRVSSGEVSQAHDVPEEEDESGRVID